MCVIHVLPSWGVKVEMCLPIGKHLCGLGYSRGYPAQPRTRVRGTVHLPVLKCTVKDWDSTGIRDLPRDAVFAITGGQVNLHGSCSMFFRPKPEPILSAQFQCVINAPTERRLRELWACWDEGSATGALALRQALLRGQDLLLMPADWWPNFQCPRRHGWWVRALSEVQVQLCSKCRNITALPDFRCTGSPCLRCEQGIRPSPGAHRDRA